MEDTKKAVTEGKLEELERQVQSLLRTSEEKEFTDYLENLSQRIIQQKYQADLLQEELNRRHQMYLTGQRLAEQTEQTVELAAEKPEPAQNPEQFQTAYVPTKKNRTESAVGAVILSIVGGAFILTAFVMLGVNYMNSFVEGMCLYGACAAVILVSEMLVYRRSKSLGSTLTAIGICGLYLSTIINYLALHNLSVGAALAITAGSMLFVIVLSRKRDSAVYRALGMIACYLCLLLLQKELTSVEYLAAAGIIFAGNLICAVLPVKKYFARVNGIHILANTFFTMGFLIKASGSADLENASLLFLLSSYVVLQLLTVLHCRREKKLSGGILSVYHISAVLYLLLFTAVLSGHSYASAVAGGILGSIAVIAFAAFLGMRPFPEKWSIYFQAVLLLITVARAIDMRTCILVLVGMLVMGKLLLMRRKLPLLKVTDLVLTISVCIMAVVYRYVPGNTKDLLCTFVLFAGVLFSIFFISFWQAAYKTILTYTLAFVLLPAVPFAFRLPVFTGVLFGGMLLFGNVRKWNEKNTPIYNWLMLSGQIICFLMLSGHIYRNELMTYLCMLVFGTATIEIVFQEKYRMNLKGKHFLTAVFFTYMALIVRLKMPVINSALLIAAAIVCIGIGFAEKKKGIRSYGLALFLAACGKIAFYDFQSVAILQKTILFFAVGSIALVAAGVYIVLEKKTR